MKDFVVVSDIHGRHGELNRLLSNCRGYFATHRIVLLGDYTGGGPKPLETLETVLWLRNSMDAVVLRGNWEDALIHAVLDNSEADWKVLGKQEHFTVDDLRHNRSKVVEIARSLELLPALHYEDGWMFAHAGVDPSVWRPGMTPRDFGAKQKERSLLWNSRFYDEQAEQCSVLPFKVACGHVPIGLIGKKTGIRPKRGEPYVQDNVYGVDFSAAQNFGYLGAMIVTNGEFETTVLEKVAS